MAKTILNLIKYLSVALIGISLVTGCKKEIIPWGNNALSQITFSFADSDNDEGEIGGDITLDLPSNLKPANVTHYVIYWGTAPDASGKAEMLAAVPAADFTDKVLHTIPENSAIEAEYFLLYLRGAEGPDIFSGKASLAADKFEGVEVPVVTDVTQPPPTKDEEPEPTPDEPVKPAETTPTEKQPVVVQKDGTQTPLIVTIENVLFEFDKSYLRSEFKQQLRNDFAGLQNKDQAKLLIAGHADERGSNEYNLALGERRAFAVKRYLISLGFLANNIRIISYGEEKPVDTAHHEDAWRKNRRAETEIQ